LEFISHLGKFKNMQRDLDRLQRTLDTVSQVDLSGRVSRRGGLALAVGFFLTTAGGRALVGAPVASADRCGADNTNGNDTTGDCDYQVIIEQSSFLTRGPILTSVDQIAFATPNRRMRIIGYDRIKDGLRVDPSKPTPDVAIDFARPAFIAELMIRAEGTGWAVQALDPKNQKPYSTLIR